MHKLIIAFLLLLPAQVLALTAADSGLVEAGRGTGLETNMTLGQWVSIIIRGALTLLAVIFIIMIIVGGFQWMTSGGNEKKIESAKGMITNAVIGVTIVMISYGITYFVFEVLLNPNNGGDGADITP